MTTVEHYKHHIADDLRKEYDECTELLEKFPRSIRARCQTLQRVLWIFSEWYANDCHTEHPDDVGALTTERGIAAFNAGLAEVLPRLPLRAAATTDTTKGEQ